MLPAAWLAVVFAGILGNQEEAGVIGREVTSAIGERAPLTPRPLPASALRVLTHHGSGSRELVVKLHVDGVVGCELIDQDGGLTLRLVVYGPDGGLRSLNEIPLRNRMLGLDDLGVIRANLSDEILALAPAAPVATPAPGPAPEAATAAAPVDTAAVDASEATTVTAPAPAPAPAAVEAQTDDGFQPDPVLGLRLGAGMGVASRTFLPGPATVAGYSSSAVATVNVAAEIRPTRRLALDALAERAVSMSTPMGTTTAATTMSRWEVSADHAVRQGSIAVAARLGLGRRAFSIDSSDPARSPNGEYNYAIAGATVSAQLGKRVSVRGLAAFEPVLWGSEPTEMAFGEARRWAFDLGAALEVRPREHVFARLAGDLQQFAWSWSRAGARGAGGAVDRYPTGSVSLGAEY